MIQGLGLGVVAALMMTSAAWAQASTTVLGGGMAQACSEAATAQVRAAEKRGRQDRTAVASVDGVRACDQALAMETLTPRDLAATYVNRGVLLMGRTSFDAALKDYDAALGLRDSLAEAHANRGAALIALRRYQEGVDEITRALAMNTSEPEKSYYNRAVGRERLDDFKGAYLDYTKALELKPAWPDPQVQLARFTLTPK